MLKHAVLLAHTPSENTFALKNAIEEGFRSESGNSVTLTTLAPLEAETSEVIAADLIMIFCTENFGYMSGALKDYFDRNFYPLEGKTEALPWALCVRAGKDGSGTVRSVTQIVGGLSWKCIAEPLVLRGDYQANFETQARDFGATMAAGLAMGIF